MSDIEEVTHALVRFIVDDSYIVVKVTDIEEFTGASHERPLSLTDFEETSTYHCLRDNDNKYYQIQILALGLNFEECSRLMDSFNDISHALVRFVKNDKSKIVDISLIKEFKENKPESSIDFKKQSLYAGRMHGDSKYSAIEIMAIGHKQILEFDRDNGSKRSRKTKFNDSDIINFNQTLTDNDGVSSSIESEEDSDTENQNIEKKKLKKRNSKTSKGNKSPVENNDNMTEDGQILKDKINSILNPKKLNSPIHTSTAKKMNENKKVSNEGSSKNVEKTDGAKKRNSKFKAKRKLDYSASKKKKVTNYSKHFRTDTVNFYDTDWSDDSVGETEELSVFEKYERSDDETTQVIHLGWNENIPYKSWKEIKKSKDPSKFTKNLLRALYKRKMVCKYLQKKPFMKKVTQEERTEITPTKLKVIYQCLKYWVRTYHENWLEDQSIEEICSKVRGYISDEISYQIRIYQNENKE